MGMLEATVDMAPFSAVITTIDTSINHTGTVDVVLRMWANDVDLGELVNALRDGRRVGLVLVDD